MALEIRKKNTDNIWTHQKNGGEVLFLSKGHFRFVGLNFELTEPSGSDNIRDVKLSDIKLYDETSGGAEETFSTVEACVTRLKDLEYPYFPIEASVNGAVDIDTFATLSGQTVTFPDSQTAYILDFTVLPEFTTLNATDLIAVYNPLTSSYGVITQANLCASCGTTTPPISATTFDSTITTFDSTLITFDSN